MICTVEGCVDIWIHPADAYVVGIRVVPDVFLFEKPVVFLAFSSS